MRRCPITAEDGTPLKDSCFWWNVAMTMIVGFFVNGETNVEEGIS